MCFFLCSLIRHSTQNFKDILNLHIDLQPLPSGSVRLYIQLLSWWNPDNYLRCVKCQFFLCLLLPSDRHLFPDLASLTVIQALEHFSPESAKVCRTPHYNSYKCLFFLLYPPLVFLFCTIPTVTRLLLNQIGMQHIPVFRCTTVTLSSLFSLSQWQIESIKQILHSPFLPRTEMLFLPCSPSLKLVQKSSGGYVYQPVNLSSLLVSVHMASAVPTFVLISGESLSFSPSDF